jgi:hypothetical protein
MLTINIQFQNSSFITVNKKNVPFVSIDKVSPAVVVENIETPFGKLKTSIEENMTKIHPFSTKKLDFVKESDVYIEQKFDILIRCNLMGVQEVKGSSSGDDNANLSKYLSDAGSSFLAISAALMLSPKIAIPLAIIGGVAYFYAGSYNAAGKQELKLELGSPKDIDLGLLELSFSVFYKLKEGKLTAFVKKVTDLNAKVIDGSNLLLKGTYNYPDSSINVF